MRPTLFALLLPLMFCACNGRWAPGYMVTEDGQMVALTDENVRANTVHTIVQRLDAALGGHWRMEATIAELPVYETDDRASTDNNGWKWRGMTTTTLIMIGDGQAEPPMKEAEIVDAVREYLYDQVERPKQNLHISITRVVDPVRFATRQAPPTTEAPAKGASGAPATPSATASRRYTVQAGDTWADLSQAFYGSAQHWRVISDANQGGELTVGREITIPPKP
jgi:hypothetical protein